MQCHLERLTEYYDMETSEYKKRSKIRFTLKIINSAKSSDKTNVIESGGIEQKKNQKDLTVCLPEILKIFSTLKSKIGSFVSFYM